MWLTTKEIHVILPKGGLIPYILPKKVLTLMFLGTLFQGMSFDLYLIINYLCFLVTLVYLYFQKPVGQLKLVFYDLFMPHLQFSLHIISLSFLI